MDTVAKTAEEFGMVDSMPKVLPAALGAVDTTVLREAAAYASLDEGGRRVVPSLIDSVQDREGHVVWRPSGLDCACDGTAEYDSSLMIASRLLIRKAYSTACDHDAGSCETWHRRAGGRGTELPDCWQDRYHPGFHGCLVCWIYS